MKFISSHFLFADEHENNDSISAQITPNIASSIRFVCNFQWYAIFRFTQQIYEVLDQTLKHALRSKETKNEDSKNVRNSLFSLCTGLILGATDASGFEQSITTEFHSEVFAEVNLIDKMLANFVKYLNSVWNNTTSLNLLSCWSKFRKLDSTVDTSSESVVVLDDAIENLSSFGYMKECLHLISQSERVFDVNFCLSGSSYQNSSCNEGLTVEVKHWKRDLFDQIRKNAEEKCIEDHNLSKYLNFNERLTSIKCGLDAAESSNVNCVTTRENKAVSNGKPVFLRRNLNGRLLP